MRLPSGKPFSVILHGLDLRLFDRRHFRCQDRSATKSRPVWARTGHQWARHFPGNGVAVQRHRGRPLRPGSERARSTFAELRVLIDSLDHVISGEEGISSTSRLFQGRRRVFERLGYSGFISPSQKPLRG